MTEQMRLLCSTLAIAGLLAGGAAHAQSQPEGTKGKTALKVEHVEAEKSMEALMEGVDTLREATILLLDKKQSEERAEAVEAAQEALLLTQRAMLQLPPELRIADTTVREAKDWPVAMARLDEATQELKASADALSKQSAGKERDQAVSTIHEALGKVQEAMAALPAAD